MTAGSGARRTGSSFTLAEALAISSGLRRGFIHGFAAEIVSGGKAPGIVDQHAYADAQRFRAAGMADFAILGGQRTLAMVHNANVGIAGAALGDRIQGPISNLFHGHNKL